MSAIAALTLADGQASPVNHTFSPVKVDAAGVAKWVDRVGGIALGYPTITMSVREPSKGSRNFKVTRKIVIPVLEVTSPSTATGIQPAPTLAYNLIQNTEWVLPERSTLAQRKDLIAFAKNFDANAVLTAAVQDNDAVY
jgi:hypothetical protein